MRKANLEVPKKRIFEACESFKTSVPYLWYEDINKRSTTDGSYFLESTSI